MAKEVSALRRVLRGASALAAAALLLWLLRPAAPLPAVPAAAGTPFAWQADETFAELERAFLAARAAGPGANAAAFASLGAEGRRALGRLGADAAAALAELERAIFGLGALAAADGALLPGFEAFVGEARSAVRGALRGADDETVRRAYRVLQGGRMALDEVRVQQGAERLPNLQVFEAPVLATPRAEVRGVRVQSGDIALSRGAAPTSALIARGSDFPGSFSHAALVHVDGATGAVNVVESLIEKGVVVTPAEEYLADPKRRILLLRLRPEALPAPGAPHRAAERLLGRARAGRVPYDFAMDWRDDSALFCSEVPYHAYRAEGVELWSFESPMSAPGLAAWLVSLGARNLTTLVPAALEFDHRLVPVAEWRRAEALLANRYDDAAMDALLERADNGLRLEAPRHLLALARVARALSTAASAAGLPRPIPDGMGPEEALRVHALNRRLFEPVREALEERAGAEAAARGYPPPYWALVRLAREAAGTP